MNATIRSLVCAAAAIVLFLFVTAQVHGATVDIAWSTVGDPGNAADPSTGWGAVNYVYNIGTYDVTLGQYVTFLNAVAANDPYSLYHPAMEMDFSTQGITRTGGPGNYSYAVYGNPTMPVFDVDFGDAVRFANWLDNGQPTGLGEVAGATETGAYTLTGAPGDPVSSSITRNSGASVFLPSENEWYKAAYYKGGGVSAGYWLYLTQSNTAPSHNLSTEPNSANYYDNGYTDPVNKLTPVGAFVGSPGPYGTFDMGGDVWQWNDTIVSMPSPGNFDRGTSGGSYNDLYYTLASSYKGGALPSTYESLVGFRVASIVPEPGSITLLVIGIGGLLMWQRRRGG